MRFLGFFGAAFHIIGKNEPAFGAIAPFVGSLSDFFSDVKNILKT